jgi:hypothetical protein
MTEWQEKRNGECDGYVRRGGSEFQECASMENLVEAREAYQEALKGEGRYPADFDLAGRLPKFRDDQAAATRDPGS